MLKLYQHGDSGVFCWLEEIPTDAAWYERESITEDELPSDITEREYTRWWQCSTVIDGERHGPLFNHFIRRKAAC